MGQPTYDPVTALALLPWRTQIHAQVGPAHQDGEVLGRTRIHRRKRKLHTGQERGRRGCREAATVEFSLHQGQNPDAVWMVLSPATSWGHPWNNFSEESHFLEGILGKVGLKTKDVTAPSPNWIFKCDYSASFLPVPRESCECSFSWNT